MNHPSAPMAALLLVVVASAAPALAEPLATITVRAGASRRVDVPVSVVLPEALDPLRPMRLVETAPDRRMSLPFQNDPAEPARIWWILSGATAPGAERTFEIEAGAPAAAPPGVEAKLDAEALEITAQGAKVLRYNHAFVPPPEGVGPAFIRDGYIHPVWSPKGKVVTEDFPKDHRHHKGVWFPWTHTEFEGHDVDFWNLGDKKGTVQFAGFDGVFSGAVFGGFRVRHEHVDLTQSDGNRGGKIALREVWDVRVWNVGGPEKGYWVWDLASTQRCAGASPLKLLQYRYGGLGFRGAKEWTDGNYEALTSEGKSQRDGHMTRAKWCDNGGKIDGEWRGALIMDHPRNFRFPQPMRLWDKGGCFFNYAPVQTADFTIEPGQDYVSRYRFVIHEGEMCADEANRLWEDWGNPPDTTIAAGASPAAAK